MMFNFNITALPMRRFHNTDLGPADLVFALACVNPNNVIPQLEQSIEVEKLNLLVNPSEEVREKIREMMFLLNFLRLRRLGG
jgi:hypothetical protein